MRCFHCTLDDTSSEVSLLHNSYLTKTSMMSVRETLHEKNHQVSKRNTSLKLACGV